MKVKVKYQRNYGVEMFYPGDEWSQRLLDVFRPPSVKAKCYSRRQVDELKSMGFSIEVVSDKVEI